MRLFVYLLSIALFSACSNTDKKKEAEYVNEKVIDYYSNGKLKLEGNTVNDKPHGLWRYYFENGFVWSEGRFRHGKRDGHSLVYYENGKKRLQGQYDEGKRVGWWLVWEEDGTFKDSINADLPLNQRDSLLLGV